jgi:hypothetical protein
VGLGLIAKPVQTPIWPHPGHIAPAGHGAARTLHLNHGPEAADSRSTHAADTDVSRVATRHPHLRTLVMLRRESSGLGKGLKLTG